jgi:hypothetical protein
VTNLALTGWGCYTNSSPSVALIYGWVFCSYFKFLHFFLMNACHVSIGGQQTHDFCQDRITTALLIIRFMKFTIKDHKFNSRFIR